ncbi:hypothetical protein AB3R30_23275 [Leptolyngbyaceae cyanobacterium UHCC 1019]
MTFNSQYDPQIWIKHVILDPQHGALFPYRMLAGAFGIGVDREPYLNQALGRLTSGQHYVEQLGRTFITLAGLYAIADLLGTPEGQLFKQALMSWSQTHQPFGGFQASHVAPIQTPQTSSPIEVVPHSSLVQTHSMPTVMSEYPSQPGMLQPRFPQTSFHDVHQAERQPYLPSGEALPRLQVAQELANVLRPEIERAVYAATATTRVLEPTSPNGQQILDALKWQRESDLQLIEGVTNAQKVVADTSQGSVKATGNAIAQVQVANAVVNESQGWRQSAELWLDGVDLPTLIFAMCLGMPLVAFAAWIIASTALTIFRPSSSLPPRGPVAALIHPTFDVTQSENLM